MLWLSSIIPCTAPLITQLIAILCVVLLVQILFISKYFSKKQYWFVLVGQVVLLAIVFWLGSYRFSPVYSNVDALRGFDITIGQRPKVTIQSGAIVSLGQNTVAAIVPLTLPGDTPSCNWSSQMGGALDEPTSCETIYAPPSADYDILRLSVHSSCGVPNASGQIKISILP